MPWCQTPKVSRVGVNALSDDHKQSIHGCIVRVDDESTKGPQEEPWYWLDDDNCF